MFRHAALGDTIYFGFALNTTGGTASDATSTPTFDVRKCGAAANAAPTLEGSATLLSHANFADGKYEISIAATGGNGFEANAEYLVFCDAAVSSVNPGGIVGGFRLAPIVATLDGDFTSTMKASINAEVDTAIADARLDHLLQNSVSGSDVADNSVIAKLVSKSVTADWDSFDNTTDSLENLRDETSQSLGTLIARLGLFTGIGADTVKGATDKLGTPAGASISADIATLLAAITALNNLSALANLYGPPVLEVPDSSSTSFVFTLVIRDQEGKLVALDGSPTITAANGAGTDRSANLSAVSNPATGRYTFSYSVASSAAAEPLRITCSGTVSGEARYIEWVGAVVDYDSTTTIAAIHSIVSSSTFGNSALNTDLDLLLTRIVGTLASGTHSPQSGDSYPRIGEPSGASIAADIATVKADSTSILGKMGSITGSGINTILGYFKAIWNKAAGLTPSDLTSGVSAGDAGDNTTDSLPAIRDRGDAAWTTGGGGGGTGARSVSVTVQNSLGAPIENAKVRFSRTGESYVQTTNASGQCSFSLDDASWTVSITAIGYTYTPSTQIVDGNETLVFTMTALSIPAASDPNTITGYIYCYDENRDPVQDVAVTCWITDKDATDGFLDKGHKFTFLSDSNGQASHAFIKSRTYEARGKNGEKVTITVPSSGTSFALPSALWK